LLSLGVPLRRPVFHAATGGKARTEPIEHTKASRTGP
jgi:hypothetical protein